MPAYHSYCDAVASGTLHATHKIYHDKTYGFPAANDQDLFKRLMMEVNQAGLSWDIILKKEQTILEAYDGFHIDKVASYDATECLLLKQNPGIIRNTLKINAAVYNARSIQQIQQSHGSFKNWLDSHHPLPLKDWVKLFKKTFKFTGGEITREFLMGTGYIEGAHKAECPIYSTILKSNPKWNE